MSYQRHSTEFKRKAVKQVESNLPTVPKSVPKPGLIVPIRTKSREVALRGNLILSLYFLCFTATYMVS